MLKALIGPIAGLASEWMKRRGEVKAAEHEIKLKKLATAADSDLESAKGMAASWKDEYLTILLTIPLIIVFHGSMLGSTEEIEHLKHAFSVMTELPDWYQWAVLGAIASSFGIRTFDKFGGGK